ncbi:MAG: hypothetical protein GXZ04_01130 [Clostridiales bacterium]|nr:hypothetical protein [Clostridiales bacterium]
MHKNTLQRRVCALWLAAIFWALPFLQGLAVESQTEIPVTFQLMLGLSADTFIYPSDSERESIAAKAIMDILNTSSTEAIVKTIQGALSDGHVYVGTEGAGRTANEFMSLPWLVMYFFGNNNVLRVMGHVKPFDMPSSNISCGMGIGLTGEINDWISTDSPPFHAVNPFSVLSLLLENGYEISTDAQMRYQNSRFEKLTQSEQAFVQGLKEALEARWANIDGGSDDEGLSEAEKVAYFQGFVHLEREKIPALTAQADYGDDFYYYASSYVNALQAQSQACDAYQKDGDYQVFYNEYLAGQAVRAIAFSWLHDHSGITVNNDSGGVDYMHSQAQDWLEELTGLVEQRKELLSVIKAWFSMNQPSE